MRSNATVSVYAPVLAPNSEGTMVKTWGYKQTPAIAPEATFKADIQPWLLKEVEIELWGLTNKIADTKALYVAGFIPALVNNSRVAVTTYQDGITRYYDILGVNSWQRHCECTLVPVQGE